MSTRKQVMFGRCSVSIDDVLALAQGTAIPLLDDSNAWRTAIARGAELVLSHVANGVTIYGVTTGFGDSCENAVDLEIAPLMPLNLARYHGCGTGEILGELEAAAVLAVRLASLSRGWSGVRLALLQRLCDLLRLRIFPRIPSQGSVGASGDLTPLSYLASTLVGEREVSHRGRILNATDALAACGLEPLVLAPKESLALMNGTAAMTGLACIVHHRARRFARFAAALTAMAVDVLRGQPSHFDERLFEAKPHAGQLTCAAWIREDLECGARPTLVEGRIQDRYSIRCAPHVIGVLVDALSFAANTIEIEINGVSDNPLIDIETGDVLHGGNFYGGHIAFVMDGLKVAVASVAELLERQLVLLLNPVTNSGLSANLVAVTGPKRAAHHGFKAMEILASALTAEALKATIPATSFSRSTESHNQDKVSMGTLATRDCSHVLDCCETISAVSLLALCQAFDLRQGVGCHARARQLHATVRGVVAMNTADRRQDEDITNVLALYRNDALPFGSFGRVT